MYPGALIKLVPPLLLSSGQLLLALQHPAHSSPAASDLCGSHPLSPGALGPWVLSPPSLNSGESCWACVAAHQTAAQPLCSGQGFCYPERCAVCLLSPHHSRCRAHFVGLHFLESCQ